MVGQEKLQLSNVTIALSCAGKVVVKFTLSNRMGAYTNMRSL